MRIVDRDGSASADSGAGHHVGDVQSIHARPKTPRKRKAKAERGPADQDNHGTHPDNVSRAKPKRRRCKAAPGEEGQPVGDIRGSPADLATTCHALKALQSRRRHLLRGKDRNMLALGSLVRRSLDWRPDLSDKEREHIRSKAAAAVAAALKGEAEPGHEWLIPFAMVAADERAPSVKLLANIEKEMIGLSRELPVYEWSRGVLGEGTALAVIVGEAGDLNNYSDPAKLWKRLGLAPKEAYPQAASGAHMTPKQRRSQIWVSVGSNLLRKLHPVYKPLYDQKKAEYLARGEAEPFWQKDGKPDRLHAHNAALRFMEKRVLKHLWRAWRAASIPVTSRKDMPPADLSEVAE